MRTPVFSLLHTTARLDVKDGKAGWEAAVKVWLERADHPERIEYVLTVDQGHEAEVIDRAQGYEKFCGEFKVNVNCGRPCAVDGWNTSAQASTGLFLITVSDDLTPPEHWDTEILKVVPDLGGEYVLDIDDGAGPNLFTFSLLTRAYYKRYGYIFYPEYVGMFGDNDFTLTAMRDKVVLPAQHLKFIHAHPAYGTAENDAVYKWQHRSEAWVTGKRLMRERWPGQVRETVILCMPGERFSSAWVANMLQTFSLANNRYHVIPLFCYSSNVYRTRCVMAEGIVNSAEEGLNAPPDVVMWLDDDNLLSMGQFNRLMNDLAENPAIDMAAGWSWVSIDAYETEAKVSFGKIDPDGKRRAFRYHELVESPTDLMPLEWTGFPVVAMRYELLRKLGGPAAFVPILAPEHPYGFSSEDTAFCARALAAGARMVADRRVRVPHLKERDSIPLGFVEAPEKKPAAKDGAASTAA